MNQTSVTVVVPVYNGELLVGRCLESVFRQSYSGDIEVIVVDDGSTDRTVEVVEGFKDSRISVISQKNQGPAAARNAGIKRAKGQYLAFLDADDYWESDFLEHTVSFLESHPEAVAVSVGQVHKVLGKPPAVVPRFLQDAAFPRQPQVLESFFSFWAEHNHVCTGSVLMRTDVVRQTGGQRTELRICEDLEFWAYLATFGKWGFVPEVLFVSDGGVITRKQGWLAKNRRRWASAPTVEQWQQRVIDRVAPQDKGGFELARARIAKNLAYSMILSNRDAAARQAIACCNGQARDRVSRLLKTASRHGRFTWKLVCVGLRLREVARDKCLWQYGLSRKCR